MDDANQKQYNRNQDKDMDEPPSYMEHQEAKHPRGQKQNRNPYKHSHGVIIALLNLDEHEKAERQPFQKPKKPVSRFLESNLDLQSYLYFGLNLSPHASSGIGLGICFGSDIRS